MSLLKEPYLNIKNMSSCWFWVCSEAVAHTEIWLVTMDEILIIRSIVLVRGGYYLSLFVESRRKWLDSIADSSLHTFNSTRGSLTHQRAAKWNITVVLFLFSENENILGAGTCEVRGANGICQIKEYTALGPKWPNAFKLQNNNNKVKQ